METWGKVFGGSSQDLDTWFITMVMISPLSMVHGSGASGAELDDLHGKKCALLIRNGLRLRWAISVLPVPGGWDKINALLEASGSIQTCNLQWDLKSAKV